MNVSAAFPENMRTSVFACLTLVAMSAVARANPAMTAAKHAEDGHIFYLGEQYDLALGEYELAYAAVPLKAYLYSIARVHLARRDFEQALSYFEQSLETGAELFALNDSQRNAAQRESAQLRPIVVAIRSERNGLELLALGAPGKAGAQFRRAYDFYAKPIYLVRIGDAELEQRNYDAALEYYERARDAGLPACPVGAANCVTQADVLRKVASVRARRTELAHQRSLDQRQTRRGWGTVGMFWERGQGDRRSLLLEAFAAHELFVLFGGDMSIAFRIAGGARSSRMHRVFESPIGTSLERYEASEIAVVGGADVELRAFRRARTLRASLIAGLRFGWSWYDAPTGTQGDPFVRLPLLLRVSRHVRHGYHVISLYGGVVPEHGPSLRYRYTGVGGMHEARPDELVFFGTFGLAYEY